MSAPVPPDNTFTFDPPVPAMAYKSPERVRSALLGCFGPQEKNTSGAPTHVLVVNLDYKIDTVMGIRGPAPLEVFDAATGRWSPADGRHVEVRLPRGGGKLVRVSQSRRGK
jgi:hypothetical protein